MNIKKLTELKATFDEEVSNIEITQENVENLRVKYLGRKGLIASIFSQMSNVSSSERPAFGKAINELKQSVNSEINRLKNGLLGDSFVSVPTIDDPDLPGDHILQGTLHPLEKTFQSVKEIFTSIGFTISYGPEIDDDFHNFEALNIPKHHPARDMQDTFYISENTVLRTHTSNTQIHIMENQQPPIRVIVPGRVYRNEAISVRSYCLFHQVEGLYVNKKVNFAELKGTLNYFIHKFFGENVKSRFRPSFFPFTEPSAEVDISCIFCKGKGCKTCKKTGWLEILGCGMIDPEVFNNVQYDPKVWKGYAFGMGIERLTMLKYGIDDIRLFFNNDVRFLRQFTC